MLKKRHHQVHFFSGMPQQQKKVCERGEVALEKMMMKRMIKRKRKKKKKKKRKKKMRRSHCQYHQMKKWSQLMRMKMMLRKKNP